MPPSAVSIFFASLYYTPIARALWNPLHGVRDGGDDSATTADRRGTQDTHLLRLSSSGHAAPSTSPGRHMASTRTRGFNWEEGERGGRPGLALCVRCVGVGVGPLALALRPPTPRQGRSRKKAWKDARVSRKAEVLSARQGWHGSMAAWDSKQRGSSTTTTTAERLNLSSGCRGPRACELTPDGRARPWKFRFQC